uniref:Reverse transcriptase domain-containing protein n=1 Tax=Cannabis sativa TaxID=3483 RepID=A0A803P4K7_CANSA
MVKKKRVGRKPAVRSIDMEPPLIQDCASTEGFGEIENEGLDLIADLIQNEGSAEPIVSLNLEQSPGGGSGNRSWAEEVEQADLRASSQQQWHQSTSGKIAYHTAKLSFMEPLVEDGKKIAKVDIEEVKIQAENWSTAVICKPIMIDKVTKERSMVKFARILVEMDITDDPPKTIEFFNEYGRGLNNTKKQDMVLDICRVKNVGVVGLLETKMSSSRIENMMSTRLNGWKAYSSVVTEGRLLILWRKTFVRERKELWRDLANLKFPTKPWLLLGDFNTIFNYTDRNGGKRASKKEIEDGNNWLAKGLVDWLSSSGSNYTWTNNQEGEDRIYLRIDHVFKNEEWIHTFPCSRAYFQWETVSDHCSCLVTFARPQNIGIKPFRYFNFWAEYGDFKEVVLASWMKPILGIGLQAIYLKLTRLKHVLRKFNKNTIGDVEVNYHRAKEKYQEARTCAQVNPRDADCMRNEDEAAKDYNKKAEMFHNKSTAVTKLNIKCMEARNKLTMEQQLQLLRPFTQKEIKTTFFSIPSSKSPGPDGFGSGFFRSCWAEIGQEVSRAIAHFFETGLLPSNLNHTAISLVLKVKNPSKAVDFRPIACCSTIYKCISKLLCLRLSEVLPTLVHQNQGAFVNGRYIAHNVLIFQDLIKDYGRKNVSARCAIKIDLSKAYDTADWGFLEDLLKAYCFPSRCQGNFQGIKGLRQGDPISPLLFVLVMEYLTKRLNLEAQEDTFRYHPLCKHLKLTSVCFANDLILFCKGNAHAVKHLKSALIDFSKASGLEINKDKSHIYLAGVSDDVKRAILQEIQIEEGSFLLKYLGVPLRLTKWRMEDCDTILRKIKLKLQTWATKHLSFARRVQLIHSVLLGFRNYWMSIFVLPQSIIKEIEKLCRGFLWGVKGNRSKIHVASWGKVFLPKGFGGLCFRKGPL